MKPFDIKPNTYLEFNKENYKEHPKFKVGDHNKTYLQKVSLGINLKTFL